MEIRRNFPYAICLKVLIMAFLECIWGCSSDRFVPEGERVLSKVELKSEGTKVDVSAYRGYVRQEANARWFNVAKVPLGLYCLSGNDSTRGLNKFFRRIGEAPVIYDSTLMADSQESITLALKNKGYLSAYTDVDVKQSEKKTKLTYRLHPETLYRIRTIDYSIDDSEIEEFLHKNEARSLLKVRMPCDAVQLDAERDRIVTLLRNNGYYNVLKKYISFDIDTLKGPDRLDLTMRLDGKAISKNDEEVYTKYRIRNVVIDVNLEGEGLEKMDTLTYRGLHFRYYGNIQLRPQVIYSQLRMFPDDYYNEEGIQATYHNFSNLSALRYAVIRMEPADSARLDCHVTLQPSKVNGISAELEGTNTSGDMGVAASLSFTNRNLFHGSELWTTKIRGAFEAITGLEGYRDQNYFEISAETHLTFPRIMVPFVGESRRKNNGNSELSLMYNSQNRPEFHRRVLTGAWNYNWQSQSKRKQHKLDVLSVNYVFMPWISSTFRHDYLDSISNRSAIVRYSYENLLIVNSAYSYTYNSAGSTGASGLYQKNAYQVHFNVESAGNFLYLLSKAAHIRKNTSGDYAIFNVAYAQYVKFDFDYTRSFLINARNSFALHGSMGVAMPYGNMSVIPFEKRYFAGGPNSVRGWGVRELGPGSYVGKDGKVDFINQTGNMKLLFSMELRSYLFWKIHGALFVDAGNIWNTRNYESQSGGQFKVDSFYKQIAASYGLGLRLNLDYFILRFDWGMKAVNPNYEKARDHYPLVHPKFGRDLTFHFAVGLPF